MKIITVIKATKYRMTENIQYRMTNKLEIVLVPQKEFQMCFNNFNK